MKKVLLFAVIFTQVLPCILAQEVNDDYKADLISYLTLSGSDLTFDTTIDQVVQMTGSSFTNEQKAQVKQRAYDKLVEYMLPIYKQNILHEDLKAMIAFFKTPAGKRISEAQSKIITETTQISMLWATDLQMIIQNVRH